MESWKEIAGYLECSVRIAQRRSAGVCAPENAPFTPKDTILTLGFGYSITPVPKFPDRPGRKNGVHFSYASHDTGLHDDVALLYLEIGMPDAAVAHFRKSLEMKGRFTPVTMSP